jgi:hypothetical protein
MNASRTFCTLEAARKFALMNLCQNTAPSVQVCYVVHISVTSFCVGLNILFRNLLLNILSPCSSLKVRDCRVDRHSDYNWPGRILAIVTQFFHFLHINHWMTPRSDNCFLPDNFQLIFYLSPYPLMLCSPATDRIVKYPTKNAGDKLSHTNTKWHTKLYFNLDIFRRWMGGKTKDSELNTNYAIWKAQIMNVLILFLSSALRVAVLNKGYLNSQKGVHEI